MDYICNEVRTSHRKVRLNALKMVLRKISFQYDSYVYNIFIGGRSFSKYNKKVSDDSKKIDYCI